MDRLARATVCIIGAGPYGVSIAAYLRSMGIDFRIFGISMHRWRAQMPIRDVLEIRRLRLESLRPGPGSTPLPDTTPRKACHMANGVSPYHATSLSGTVCPFSGTLYPTSKTRWPPRSASRATRLNWS